MRRPFLLFAFACAPADDRPATTDSDPATDATTDSAETDTQPPTDSPSDDGTDEDPRPRVQVTEGGVVTCANPAARAEARFDRLSDPGGLDTERWDPQSRSLFAGGGAGVGDFDGDGILDLMLPTYEGLLYYKGSANLHFVDQSTWLPMTGGRVSSAIPVDIDDDGDLDVHISNFQSPNQLFVNDGTGRFADATALAGMAGAPEGRTIASSWGDLDRDGDLDAFVAEYGALGSAYDGDPSYLYINQGGGVFLDRSDMLTDAVQKAHTFTANWDDLNLDGWPDLYFLNDFGWRHPNAVYLNDQAGNLVELETEHGLDTRLESMGLAAADLNHDGLTDYAVTAWGAMRLYESAPGLTWFETSAVKGLRFNAEQDNGRDVAWGSEFADLDNDTDDDLFVAFGFLNVGTDDPNPEEQPDALFEQQPDGRFSQQAESWGLANDLGRKRGFVIADLNRDGWLDLVRRDLRGPTMVDVARCGENTWIGLQLRQPTQNRYAIGARVRVSSGPFRQTRVVRVGGTSYASAGPAELHFGLGSARVVDEVEITWPDGQIDTLNAVTANQWVRVDRLEVE
jgi:hypothetical protein